MDEVSSLGKTFVHQLDGGTITNFEITPESAGLPPGSLDQLKGGDATENAKILTNILNGTLLNAPRNMVLINAAAGFLVANKCQNLQEGVNMAAEVIDSGKASKKLRAMQSFTI